MQVDFYTKAVLTVIACCLLYFVVRDLSVVPDAHAVSQDIVDVNIVEIRGLALDSAAASPIRVKVVD